MILHPQPRSGASRLMYVLKQRRLWVLDMEIGPGPRPNELFEQPLVAEEVPLGNEDKSKHDDGTGNARRHGDPALEHAIQPRSATATLTDSAIMPHGGLGKSVAELHSAHIDAQHGQEESTKVEKVEDDGDSRKDTELGHALRYQSGQDCKYHNVLEGGGQGCVGGLAKGLSNAVADTVLEGGEDDGVDEPKDVFKAHGEDDHRIGGAGDTREVDVEDGADGEAGHGGKKDLRRDGYHETKLGLDSHELRQAHEEVQEGQPVRNGEAGHVLHRYWAELEFVELAAGGMPVTGVNVPLVSYFLGQTERPAFPLAADGRVAEVEKRDDEGVSRNDAAILEALATENNGVAEGDIGRGRLVLLVVDGHEDVWVGEDPLARAAPVEQGRVEEPRLVSQTVGDVEGIPLSQGQGAVVHVADMDATGSCWTKVFGHAKQLVLQVESGHEEVGVEGLHVPGVDPY